MISQPYKKALAHLEKAENFAERLANHLKEARVYIENVSEKPTPAKKKRKSKR